MNVRETRSDNQEWTIQRHWQHWVHKTQTEDKQNQKHNNDRHDNVVPFWVDYDPSQEQIIKK